jgi:hypothetical protein
MIQKKIKKMWDFAAGFFGLKYIIGLIGGLLVMLGASIEPQGGIWIVAIGGTLLTASFGKDRSLHAIIIYVFLGLGWGIFGSQILVSIFPSMPQKAFAFFTGMFGAEATLYVINSFREGSFAQFISTIIVNFKPFNFNSTINKGPKL